MCCACQKSGVAMMTASSCLLLVEHLAVVLVAVHLVLEPLEGVDDAPLVVVGPDVAHGAEAQARDAEHRFGQHLALRPGAEEGDVDLLQAGRGRRRRGGRLRPRLLILALPAATRSRRDPAPGPWTAP